MQRKLLPTLDINKPQKYSNESNCVNYSNSIKRLPIPFSIMVRSLNHLQVDKFIEKAHLHINKFMFLCKSQNSQSLCITSKSPSGNKKRQAVKSQIAKKM